MKITTYILAFSLFAPVLLTLGSSAVAATSLIVLAGLVAITVSDYGQSTEPSYAKANVAVETSIERLPLAA